MIRRTLYVIIALIICLLVWWIGPLIAIGTFHPLGPVWVRGIIIALVLIWALWPFVASCLYWLFRQVREPKKESGKTRHRDNITARFYDAIRTLKHVGLSEQKSAWKRFCYRFSRRYVNNKPWFLVMGPSGCGKTSIINESGKRFTLSQQYGFTQTTDVGATRDCNWWLTDEAVYLDTAGEWVQVDGQSEGAEKAQKTLFSLIRRFRRQPGIDGVLLCLDASWLLHASLTERKSMADTLRARALEVAAKFRNDIAVYLAINNIDNLPGGATFLSVMAEDILAKGLGFAMSYDEYGSVDFKKSESAYIEMAEHVSSYVQEILHSSHSAEVRQQLLFFTESIGALQKPLFNLVEQVFPQSAVGYAGLIRQIWFGSTQSLYPTGLINNSELEELEARPAGHIYAVMLDNAIAERGVLSARILPFRDRMMRNIRYGLAGLVLASSVMLLVQHYFWEEEYISFITARFDETKRIVREIPATNHVSDDLISAYEQLGYMSAQLSPANIPLVNPYIEHNFINKATEQTYHRHLFKFFWPALNRYVTAELGKDLTTSDADVYNTLKIYLMMGKPEHRSAEDLESWFMTRWKSFAPQGYSDADKRLFGLHLKELFSEKLIDQAPVADLNSELIRLARVKATAIPIHVRVVRGLQAKVQPARIDDVTLSSAAGPNVSLMLRRKSQATVSDTGVPAFYTLASFHDVFLPELEDAVTAMIREEAWVLRDSEGKVGVKDSLTSQQRLMDETHKLYLLEYADNWDKFLKDIRVRQVSGLEDAALLARQFADPSSPLANLLRFVTRQTSLSGTNRNDVSSWFEKRRADLKNVRRDLVGEISGERARYRVTPEQALEQRFETVRRLGQQLMDSAGGSSSDPLARSFEELYNQLSTLAVSLRAGEVLPQNSAINRLRISAARQPEPVRSIMQDLLDIGNSQSLQQSRNNLNNSATSFASDICRNVVAKRYPFSRHAKQQVGISDFERMFGPNGTMKRYFNEHLAAYVDTNSGRWRVREGSQSLLSVSTLRAFENAALISDTFFSNNSDKVSFSMYLRPLSLSPNIMEAILDVDGQIIRYSHGSIQPVNVKWPGKNGGAYVRLSFKNMNGRVETVSFNGPWALFYLYDNSNPVPIDRDRRELTMAISSIEGVFKVELLSTMKDFPLWSRALSQFSCPSVNAK